MSHNSSYCITTKSPRAQEPVTVSTMHRFECPVTYYSSSCRYVNLSEVLSIIPSKCSGEEPRRRINAVEATNLLGISLQDNLVSARNFNTNTVISEALSWVEVKDKD